MNIKESLDNNYSADFEAWHEFVDYAEKEPMKVKSQTRTSRESNKEFTGVENFEQALEFARGGWNQGTSEIKKMSNAIFVEVSKMVERVDCSHDVEGHAIDISRFVDGEPEAWIKFENVIEESKTGNKLIHMVFNAGASAGISNDVIKRKGAAIAALIELLEYAGFRIKLDLVMGAGHRGSSIMWKLKIPLKDYDQNLDMQTISYALVHPSLLRSLIFSAMEVSPKKIYDYYNMTWSKGSPVDVPQEERGDIYIPKMHLSEKQWENEELAKEWIIENLKSQGVHLKLKEEIK